MAKLCPPEIAVMQFHTFMTAQLVSPVPFAIAIGRQNDKPDSSHRNVTLPASYRQTYKE
jgi:hypothetical protein